VQKIIHNMDVKIHGTYPWDEMPKSDKDPMPWKSLRKISYQEAASLTKLPKELIKNCEAQADKRINHDVYLWLNKGFIVIDLLEDKKDGDPGIVPDFGYAQAEVDGATLRSPKIKPGMKAVYLADGNYYLLERVA
jgi:hypothetical protein